LLSTFERQADNPNLNWIQFTTSLRQTTEIAFTDWKQKALASPPTTRDLEIRAALRKQVTQAPQFYFVPGVRLGVACGDTNGKGVRVVGFTAGSAMERAGIKMNEDIVAVTAEGRKMRIADNNDWDRVMDPLLGKITAFTFTVRGHDQRVRQVSVSLQP